MNIRIIPCLLLKNQSLVKTIKFKNEIYVGDPINAVRIFNDKEVDELVILDISATKEKRGPNFKYIKSLASECFMPFAYGGGITNLEQIAHLNTIGVEKVIINSQTFIEETFIINAVKHFGSSSIVVSIDVKKDIWGNYIVYHSGGSKKTNYSFKEILHKLNEWEVGEVILNSIDRDGMMVGYDKNLIKKTSEVLNMPLIALGGASSLENMREVVMDSGASAAAAGSLFVFYGKFNAVLINYPNQ